MNLIICFTPLQALIAEKIIEKYPEKPFHAVFFMSKKNVKFFHYAQRLKKICYRLSIYSNARNKLALLIQILKIKLIFSGKKFDQIFVANIDTPSVHFMLSAIQYNKINTFDDGSANIIKNSFLYQKNHPTIIRKCLDKLLFNTYNAEVIKTKISTHYSIYKGFDNIHHNIEYIEINPKLKSVNPSKTIKVLLGQPIFDNDQQNIKLVQDTIKKFNIDFYFPHPREGYVIENVNYIESELIIEEFIVKHSQNTHYQIYTYFSSAALNLINISPNIEIIALRIDTNNPAYINVYNLFQTLNVNIVDIRNNI